MANWRPGRPSVIGGDWRPMTRDDAESLLSPDVAFVVRVAATGKIGVAIDYDADASHASNPLVVFVATPAAIKKAYTICHDIETTGYAPDALEVQRT